MPTIRGYVMIGKGEAGNDLAIAEAMYEVYARECGDAYAVAPLVVEDTAMAKRGFLSRPLGLKLSTSLAAGDLVVIPISHRAFKGIRDMLDTLRTWAARDVEASILDLGLDSKDDSVEATAEKLDLLDRAARFASLARGLTVKRRIANGKTRGKFHGRPPFGLRVTGPHGARRYEVTQEFEVGKMIVAWRLAGHGWEAIRLHLRANRIFKPALPGDPVEWRKTGRPWTETMIRRAHTGTIRLMNWIERGKVKDTTKEVKDAGPQAAGDGVPGQS